MFIHNRAHHKHSEYIISSLNFSRLNDEELKLIACIARYHRKAAPSESHLLYGSLSGEQQLLVQKLSAILRVANALDRSHKQKIKDLEIKIGPTATITFTADSDAVLETQDFQEKKAALEEILGTTIALTTRR
jgi:exopolyphosphatase/guanosine-5'-triphosphate,3'-diphosphate pyrophosphatase